MEGTQTHYVKRRPNSKPVAVKLRFVGRDELQRRQAEEVVVPDDETEIETDDE